MFYVQRNITHRKSRYMILQDTHCDDLHAILEVVIVVGTGQVHMEGKILRSAIVVIW